MREQFENMPEVHKKLKDLHPTIVWFSDQENEYASSFDGFQSMVIWLNGAWYAYQELQKNIDAITKQRDSFIKSHHIAMNDVCENKAKNDELQKLRSLDEMAINQLAQANQVWRTKCDELQARIDGALNTLCKLQYSSGERIYNDVGSILKGNKDEN